MIFPLFLIPVSPMCARATADTIDTPPTFSQEFTLVGAYDPREDKWAVTLHNSDAPNGTNSPHVARHQNIAADEWSETIDDARDAVNCFAHHAATKLKVRRSKRGRDVFVERMAVATALDVADFVREQASKASAKRDDLATTIDRVEQALDHADDDARKVSLRTVDVTELNDELRYHVNILDQPGSHHRSVKRARTRLSDALDSAEERRET
jgi:hypothetical protein